MPRLTKTIAELLAKRIQRKVADTLSAYVKTLENTVLGSKDYKKYVELVKKHDEEYKKLCQLKEQIVKKYTNDQFQVSIYGHTSTTPVKVTFHSRINTERITEKLILEDYFANSTMSADELVDKVAAELIS
jgi:hypothetical protein